MDIAKYLDKLKNIQDIILDFVENVEDDENKFKNLKIKFIVMKIRNNKHDFGILLHFISAISNNYYRDKIFFGKIELILQFFEDEIKKFYSNSEIFSIFKTNKRILLFLIKEKIITVDESIAKKITIGFFAKCSYPQYFMPEIKKFGNEKWFPKDQIKELPDNFDELRDKGENESFICKLIREDLVKDFIVYFNSIFISPNAVISQSIFETNSFLLEKQIQSEKGVRLIEYAAFFGSIKIFTFLKNKKAVLTPSLWLYVIHGKNAELIHLLEDLNVEPIFNQKEILYISCFKISIKCHHNDIANYFINNYLQKEVENLDDTIIQSLKYYNFSFLQNEIMNESLFPQLCRYDYYALAENFLTNRYFDVNELTIKIIFFNDI